MRKRKTVWHRILMTFLLIGTILAQMIAGVGIGEAMQVAAEETETKIESESEEAVAEDYSEAAVSLEDYIVDALKKGTEMIDVSAYQLPVSESEEFDKILKNHGEIFYVYGYAPYYGVTADGKEIVVRYRPYYYNNVPKDKMAEMSAELETAAEKAIACTEPDMKPYEKVLAVHDYLILNCKYDYANYLADTIPYISGTAYGALVDGKAVCEGYTQAFLYIMNKLGIPCRYVRGYVGTTQGPHAWNMVQLDGKWYHVDVTWDDPVWDCIGRVDHTYFLLSDSKISNGSKDAPSGHNHYRWTVKDGNDTVDIVADDAYDEAFWTGIMSAICFYNGGWYYSKYERDGNDSTAIKLVRRESLLDGTEKVVDGAPAWSSWWSWGSSYMYLAQSGEYLYYNTPTEIRRLGKDGSVSVFSLKEALGEKEIYGFSMQDGDFLYAPDYFSYSNTEQTDIRTVAAADADFKIVGSSQVDDTETLSLKKGDSIIKGNLKFIVLDPGKKTVSVEGVASAKKKKFVVNIPSTVVINGSECRVTEVKKKGFAKFAKITKVSLGKNITKVGKSAFDGCKAITSLIVNGDVKTFDSKSFNGCKRLKTITFKGKEVPTFKSKAFKGTASKVKVKLAKKMSKKDKTNMKKKLKKAGIKKIS